jgi:hypothetical protein
LRYIMGKYITAFLLLAGLTAPLSALKVHLAPLSYIDETRDAVDAGSRTHWELLSQLRAVETGGALTFSRLDNELINPPQSLLDAVRVCRDERIDYLLYGYVAKKAYSFYGEIKLFDYEKRNIIRVFYGTDDLDRFERMMADLAGKISAFINDEFHLNIIEPGPEYTELWAPAGIGYWTPMERRWTSLLIGTVLLDAGIRFTPRDRLFVLFGRAFYVSLAADISWRLGVGSQSAYEGTVNSVTAGGLLRLHMKLDDEQQLFAGGGVLYSLDMVRIKEPYEDRETKLFNTAGLAVSLGYSFQVNQRIYLFFDNIFEVRFYPVPMASYAPRAGIAFLILRQEAVRKW